MSPFRGIIGSAFGAVLGIAPQPTTPLRNPPPPLVAPVPREKPAAVTEPVAEKEDKAVTRPANAPFVAPAPTSRPSVAAVIPPIPRPNPFRLRLATLAPAGAPPASRSEGAARTASLPNASTPRHGEDPVCVNALMDARVQFKVMPSNEKGSCGAVQPLQVSVSSAGVKFSPAAVMVCSQTRAVMEWIERNVQPAADAYLGGPVTAIEVADSYSCRGLNNVPGAKLSEHAAANALDVGGFQVGTGKAARMVRVAARKDPNDPEGKFLDAVRKAACAHFSTVLGPGQPDHDTHFHLDNAIHGRSGTYRICQ